MTMAYLPGTRVCCWGTGPGWLASVVAATVWKEFFQETIDCRDFNIILKNGKMLFCMHCQVKFNNNVSDVMYRRGTNGYHWYSYWYGHGSDEWNDVMWQRDADIVADTVWPWSTTWQLCWQRSDSLHRRCSARFDDAGRLHGFDRVLCKVNQFVLGSVFLLWLVLATCPSAI